jgi:hypothetical protein
VALTPVDRLLGGYVAFVTLWVIARGMLASPAGWWMLGMHALFALLLWLFTRLRPEHRLGTTIHTLYPLFLLLAFYGEFALTSAARPDGAVLENDALIQRWEAALFGGQVSYDWIRRSPSAFWSGLLHAAYFAFYLTVWLGPILLVVRGNRRGAMDVVFRTMVAFVPCYVMFLVYPVAGPYYAFEPPAGPVREVWSADLVYATLATGSSLGAAFPSSHVAASVAANLTLGHHWPRLAAAYAPLTVLLTVGTVYCQMHYAIDALSGVVIGGAAYGAGSVIRR